MDVHVARAVTLGLRLRGVDVLTAQEDRAGGKPDLMLLDRAKELGRLLFTQDEDFLKEAHERQRTGKTFLGIIFAHQMDTTIGQLVNDLELIAKAGIPGEFEDRVEFLPLK